MGKKKELLNYFNVLKKHSILGSSYLFIGQDQETLSDILKLIGCDNGPYFCDTCWDCKRLKAGSHPDLLIVEPQNLTTRIESIRQISQFLSLKSFRLGKKMVIIKDAGSLSLAAANAFLKTLEEPPKNSFIALYASKLEGILPTITSRCRKIFLPSEEQAVQDLDIEEVCGFLQGGEKEFRDRSKFGSFLWTLILLLRSDLLSKLDCRNNELPRSKACEIILRHKNTSQIYQILEDVLRIYQAYSNININLALNLLRIHLN